MEKSGPKITSTPLGFLVLFVSIVLLLAGAFFLSPALLLSGLLGIILWFSCRRASAESVEGLRFARELPGQAWTGKSFAVETRIDTTKAKRRETRITFQDPVAADSIRHLFIPSHENSLILRYPARCGMRGQFQFPHWTISSTWPLGWFSARLSGSFESAFEDSTSRSHLLTVIPDPFLPSRLLRHLDGSFAPVHHITGQPDPIAEFRLLREFQHGDPIRSIHWPSSLRNDGLLVREPDPPRPLPRRYGILLHSFSPEGVLFIPEAFEQVLRILSGLFYRLRSEGIELLTMQAGGETKILKRREDFDTALSELSKLRRIPIRDLSKLANACTMFDECDDVFVLSDTPQEHWTSALRERPGVHLVDSSSLSISSHPTLPHRSRRAS